MVIFLRFGRYIQMEIDESGKSEEELSLITLATQAQ